MHRNSDKNESLVIPSEVEESLFFAMDGQQLKIFRLRCTSCFASLKMTSDE